MTLSEAHVSSNTQKLCKKQCADQGMEVLECTEYDDGFYISRSIISSKSSASAPCGKGWFKTALALIILALMGQSLASESSTVAATLNLATVAPRPTSTQSGIAPNCNNYAKSLKGDNCYDFALAHYITPAQLYAWNLVLGPDGKNCDTQFQVAEYYCIGLSSPATTTMTPASSKTSTAAPGPTQPGITPNCNKYAEAQRGDNCYNFALAQGITTDQLYAWNTILGPNGSNRDTGFLTKVYYCVGVS